MEFKRKGYYLRLLPAQCTLWDNVLIGRDPQTAEVMLSLLRKAEGGERGVEEGGLEVGGWLCPNRFKKNKTEKKPTKSFFYTCLNQDVCRKLENY